MATKKEYKDFILEQLSTTENITVKPMMGEYLLYKDGVLFGGIYDNRLLVKITDTNKKYGFNAELPYSGAKPMYLVGDVDDKEKLSGIISDTCKGLL
nr:TfoX/Sxy family protein [Clostridia bacterium]